MRPYDVVAALEEVVAEYGGSKYAVAVDSCTNALLLSLKYRFANGYQKVISLPCQTYVGVPYAVLNAGGTCEFRREDWKGIYYLGETKIVDSARRFTRGMYRAHRDTLYCLSAHWGKHLKIGRGGFILTDQYEEAVVLRIMRFDGRTAGLLPKMDNFIYNSNHCYMLPEEAARGLMLMSYMPNDNEDIPWDDYPFLDKFDIFKGAL